MAVITANKLEHVNTSSCPFWPASLSRVELNADCKWKCWCTFYMDLRIVFFFFFFLEENYFLPTHHTVQQSEYWSHTNNVVSWRQLMGGTHAQTRIFDITTCANHCTAVSKFYCTGVHWLNPELRRHLSSGLKKIKKWWRPPAIANPVDLQAAKACLSDFCLVVAFCIHFHREDWVDAMTPTALQNQADSGTRTSPQRHRKGSRVESHTHITEITALRSLALGHININFKRNLMIRWSTVCYRGQHITY